MPVGVYRRAWRPRPRVITWVGSAVGPVNTVAPAVTGTTNLGDTLTTDNGTWTGTPVITYAYQWQRDDVNIGGATAATRVIAAADQGHNLRCVVTATNSDGSASANSNETTVPAAAATQLVFADTGALVAALF